ncbi:MAG: PAS domain-containing sensor histidine kinase, partial [Acidobacteria bacterium]
MTVPKQHREVIDLLFEHLHDVYYETTPEGTILHVSPGVRRLLGFEPRELEGRPVVERYADPAQREHLIARLRSDGYFDDADIELIDREGRLVPCSLSAVLLPRPGGRGEVICGLLRAIRDRKRIERDLRESEERFRVVFETTPDPIAITRVEDGVFVDVNEAMVRATGFRRDELIGRSTLDLGIWASPAQRQELVDRLARDGVVRDLEVRYRLRDGRVLAALTSARLVSISGKPYILTISRDVETLRRLKREHERLAERMRQSQKLESLGLLAGGIAHDFNNLLVAVLGNAELLAQRMSDDDPLREPVSQIAEAATRASELCRELLAYAGRGHLEITVCDLNRILEDSRPLLRFFPSKKATIELRPAQRPLPIRADATQIRQLILNLATNAVEALGDAAGTVRIETARTPCTTEFLRATFVDDRLEPGDYAVLSVVDDGCGMTPETCERIFDPFFSTKVRGRGIGLATVLGIVRAHHGAIRIDSAVGRGTTVEVFLPL